MADVTSTISHQSWASRLGGSLKGVLVGVGFIFVSIWLLVWNEGNTVAVHKALEEGEQLTTKYPVLNSNGTTTIDSFYEGKLIYVTSTAQTDSAISDSEFGVKNYDDKMILKLKRTVEMYQWAEKKTTETKKNSGGSTTSKTIYTYHKQWDSSPILSSSFNDEENHRNPSTMPFTSITLLADPITLGPFTLYDTVTDKMDWFQPVIATATNGMELSVENIPAGTIDTASYTVTSYSGDGKGSGFYLSTASSSSSSSSNNPSIGDIKITYQMVPSNIRMAVIGRQSSDSLTNYITSNDREILLVEKGTPSIQEMFLHAQKAATAQAWFFRLFGFLLLWVALQMIIQPLLVFSDVLPFIGTIFESLGCCFTGIISLVVSAIVIALSWIAVRPVLSFVIFGCVGVVWYYVNVKYNNRPSRTRGEYGLSRTDDDTDDHELELRAATKSSSSPRKASYSDLA